MTSSFLRKLLCKTALLVVAMFSIAAAQSPMSPGAPVLDFSYAGYAAGKSIPAVAAVLQVQPSGEDDTARIQGALDQVAAMPVQTDGFRGAVQLAAGRYHLLGQLHMRASGVVLRGAGVAATTLIAEGTSRRTLLEIGALRGPELGTALAVDQNAAAGSRTLHLASTKGLQVGTHVVVRRPSTEAWIAEMDMNSLPGTFANIRLDWKPGSHDLLWDRTIAALHAQEGTVELDAPITTALESRYGGGTLTPVAADPEQVGVEDLTLESAYDNSRPKDEEHAWIAILLDHVQDSWVRSVTARHFVSSAVRVNLHGRRITVVDCRSEAPVSEEAGYRRQSFRVDGQQVLVVRSHSEAGMNDFASGLLAGGPNVFLDCDAVGSLGASGAFEGWSSGVLYEQVHVPDAKLQLILDFSRAQGAGWTAANSLIWNSTAMSVDALGPPGAGNYAVRSSQPLYAAQLLARTGLHLEALLHRTEPAPRELPLYTLTTKKVEALAEQHPVQIVNGRFVVDGQIDWGESQTEAWWRGDTSPYTALQSTGGSVTRFMPGVTAPGETENLPELIARLKNRGAVSIQVNPGLWYDHRRDAHTMERREDGNVWAPFFESPWARSGQGIAWDGLSHFDLTRYNPWYFERHREFARLAAEAGIVVFYNLYNTHNVLEIGPHWIDYAWRPANNINETGLPEPPPLKANGRNDVANEFFNTESATLRALHRAYILHTLDELGSYPNLIFGVAYQYAGPLSFEQFFQDTVREWEQQHDKHIRIALTTSKQTTDAILADPIRSRQIAVVDMRYWEYRPDGTLFAPQAGVNRAFREQISAAFPGSMDTPPATTPEQVYRQIREYRDHYPEIALMPMEDGAGPIPLLMAGAAAPSALQSRIPAESCANPIAKAANSAAQSATANTVSASDSVQAVCLSADQAAAKLIHNELATSLMKISPQDGWVDHPERTWVLAGASTEPVVIYSLTGIEITLAKALPAASYTAQWFNPRTGEMQDAPAESNAAGARFAKPDSQAWLLLLLPSSPRK